MSKVVVAGSLNYDIFLSLSSVPRLGETAKASASGGGAGGKGANQAVQMAKLGLSVSMIGCTGADWMGSYLRDGMTGAGVDCTRVKKAEKEKTGMGIVDVFPDGSVMAVISEGANGLVTKEDIAEADALIRETDMMVLQLEIPLETVVYAVETAAGYGKKILMNAAPAAALPEECIRKCTYFVVNEVEASYYAGRAVDSPKTAMALLPGLAGRYGNCWICTLGEHGAVIAQKGQAVHIPAVQTDAVETTGAGDSFVGGFAYGILRGMAEEDAARFAAWCSAVTIRSVGAQESMPTLQEINRLKNEYGVI